MFKQERTPSILILKIDKRYFFLHFPEDRTMAGKPTRREVLRSGLAAAVGTLATGGHQFAFGPARIHVLATPGHTEGAVSYLVEVDSKRVVFSGDCIYDGLRTKSRCRFLDRKRKVCASNWH